MVNLFSDNLQKLSESNHPVEVGALFTLIEEYFLADLIGSEQLEGILKVAEEKYDVTMNVEVTDAVLSVKMSIISLFTTVMLFMLDKNENKESFTIFGNILLYVFKDYFTDIEDTETGTLGSFRSMSVTLINRFVIMDVSIIFGLIQDNSIDFNQFFEAYVYYTQFCNSKPTGHLMTLAACQVFPEVNDQNTIKNNLNMLFYFILKKIDT
jgi:hypothetical protein